MKRVKRINNCVLMVFLGGVGFALTGSPLASAQVRRPITIEKFDQALDERLDIGITLDVRDMNVIDVIKFLSLKGNFNMVTSDQVEGRVTLFLKQVSIRDALDIVLISNNLAYYVENNIVHVLAESEYQAMFGKRYNDKNEVRIINLKYAKPSYVLAALDNIKSSLGRIIIDEDTGSVVLIDTPQALDEMQTALAAMEQPAEIFTHSLQYAKADVLAGKLRARVDALAVGSITADERSNQIIVRAQPGRIQEVREMIETLDVPTKEVLVEARIVQITYKPQYDLGIDWDYAFKDSSDAQLQKLKLKSVFLDTSKLGTNFGQATAGDIDVDKFVFTVRALKQVNDTKILSNPKILVTNNQEAKIHVGDTVPYIISTTSGTGDNAITSEDVRFVDVGLKLNVTPTINDDGYITLRLKPEISTVATTVSSKGGGIPQVNKTDVETTIMVKDGMTVILGGLKKDNKVTVDKGIPVLKEIPVFGKWFTSTSDSIELTEIVIFITPHIITGSEPYDRWGGPAPIESSLLRNDSIEIEDKGTWTIKE